MLKTVKHIVAIFETDDLDSLEGLEAAMDQLQSFGAALFMSTEYFDESFEELLEYYEQHKS